ncbi:MAG: 16S rRNA (cytidine(1402)-2'-O)-methyltransferase [Anaerolineae bacterium]|nr:16S rRNA (cytidine(1402)-2'-O)-methyltransferase [Anaerolineae bacterium]
MGTLYVVGTPIGNLEDITLRALRILGEVSLIAAEDTRRARKLLEHYGIKKPVVSYHEYSGKGRIRELIKALQKGDVALISDAGMPGLSDPGYSLIKEAIEEGINVVPVPGPSALVTALVVSGLPTHSFIYLGFLPRTPSKRKDILEWASRQPHTIVLFEAPHRLIECLEELLEFFGNRPVAVARELTKLHEEIWRGTLQEALEYFQANPPIGECTLVIGGAEEERWDEETIMESLKNLLEEGLSVKEASKQLAELSGWPRSDLYRMALKIKASETKQ